MRRLGTENFYSQFSRLQYRMSGSNLIFPWSAVDSAVDPGMIPPIESKTTQSVHHIRPKIVKNSKIGEKKFQITQ